MPVSDTIWLNVSQFLIYDRLSAPFGGADQMLGHMQLNQTQFRIFQQLWYDQICRNLIYKNMYKMTLENFDICISCMKWPNLRCCHGSLWHQFVREMDQVQPNQI